MRGNSNFPPQKEEPSEINDFRGFVLQDSTITDFVQVKFKLSTRTSKIKR